MDLTDTRHLDSPVRTDREWLEPHWMPFTANRDFKAHHV